MRILTILLTGALVVSSCAGNLFAGQPIPQIDKGTATSWDNPRAPGAQNAVSPRRASAASTTFLAYYTFDTFPPGGSCLDEGWTSADLTAQTGDYWHVDDFSGLGGGGKGLLVPIEGNQSLWCGARPNGSDPVLCGYASLPGYGNGWDQAFCSKFCETGLTGVQVHLSVVWDTEPGYDAAFLQVDNCDGYWMDVYGGPGVWDGTGSDVLSIAVSDTIHSGSLSFRFRFTSSGGWSDQDGLWDTDGGVIIDQLSVTDISGTVIPYEDFEDESVGAINATDWESCTPPGYGDYAGLGHSHEELQEDGCVTKWDCVWNFHTGSPYNYACGGAPSQKTIPYFNVRDQYIHNEIWSPDILLAGTGSSYQLRFDVYRDLPLDALVFYTWRVRSVVAGCDLPWRGRDVVYYGGNKDWFRPVHEFGDLVDPNASHINIALGVIDMCGAWCGELGTGSCHSHAPLLDGVEVYSVVTQGPVWSVRDVDLFQDNFAEDGTLTGTARADAAVDILPRSSLYILPGDSVVVSVGDPDAGLGYHVPGDPLSGPAVYLYCAIDGPGAAATGGDLVTDTRYNYVGTVAAGGRTWHQIQMDDTWTASGDLVPGRYNVDLNDNLFVPGDTVWYYFGARNNNFVWSYWALPVPTPTARTEDIDLAANNPDEFTILPAGGYVRGGDILFVDGMDGRGAQPFFDTAFELMDLDGLVDRYDIRGPSSAVGNHPGGRVVASSQLYEAYRKIVWTCGDLETAWSDGAGSGDKSDDTGLVFNFLDNLAGNGGGIYLSGDDAADVWLNSHWSGSSTQLRTKFMNFNLVAGNHVPVVGVSPYVVGEPAGFFRDGFGVDTLVAYGGCPIINDFDVITPAGPSSLEASYHGNGNTAGAIVSQATTNAVGNTVGFLLSGFSYNYARDSRAQGIPQRSEHLYRIVNWLGNIVDYPVATRTGPIARNELRQNFPNPFNPRTTIRYQVTSDGPITLRIYNVAGQLVRTLVDDNVTAGLVHEIEWRGRNDYGREVSSGVYFYRLVTDSYTETRKMVLLK